MKKDQSIHEYEYRLARYRVNLKQMFNGQTALQFLDHLGALNLSTGRVAKYASHLPAILRLTDNVELKNLTKPQIEAAVAAINTSNNTEWTKHDKKLTLRKLVQYAKTGTCARNAFLPPEVEWISLRVKETEFRVTPEGLLTSEDFVAIIKATHNRRDRALLYVLFEGALRPGELLTMRTSSVEFNDEGYCLISVNGKTGLKRIPLVISCKPLMSWLAEHPYSDEPNAPLWCSFAPGREYKQLTYRHFRVMIKAIAKKAGLKKDIWPYLYRHTSLTAMAKVFTECKLEQFAGWTYGSKMTRRYVHFSARDLEDSVLELHGFKAAQKSHSLLKMITCHRCATQNPLGSIRCDVCGAFLDEQIAQKFDMPQSPVRLIKEEDVSEKQWLKLDAKQEITAARGYNSNNGGGGGGEDLAVRLERLEGLLTALLAAQKGSGGS